MFMYALQRQSAAAYYEETHITHAISDEESESIAGKTTTGDL